MSDKPSPLHSSSFSRSLPWILFGIGLLVIILAYSYVQKVQRLDLHDLFEADAAKISEAIENRMENYTLALLSTRGLFEASTSIERDEFASYVSALHIDKFLPGMQGIGYSEYVGPRENIAAIEERVRAEGFPEFRITPQENSDEHHAIVFLEPFTDRNKRAFGYDMYTESTRREAMDRARDTGIPALLKRVTLLQEKEGEIQAGTLLYVPFYDQTLPNNNPLERRRAFKGFIYAPLRMGNVFNTVVPPRDLSGIDVEIYDGSESDEHLLYTNEHEEDNYTPLFTKEIELMIGGRTWILDMHSAEHFDALLPITTQIIVIISGLLISSLLALIAFSLVRTTERSEKRAKEIAAELRSSEESWKLALEANGDSVWDWDVQTNTIKRANRFAQMLGYDPHEIASTKDACEKILHPDDISRTKTELENHFNGKTPVYVCENRMRMKDGSYKWILDRGKVVSWTADGKPLRMIGTFTDIQERKEVEAELMKKNEELERSNKLMIGRELRMKELKEELEHLRTNPESPSAP